MPIEYSETGGRIPKEKRDPKLYYYELRDSEVDDGYTIERYVLVNNIGTLVTTQDILGDKDFITDEEFSCMCTVQNPELISYLFEED